MYGRDQPARSERLECSQSNSRFYFRFVFACRCLKTFSPPDCPCASPVGMAAAVEGETSLGASLKINPNTYGSATHWTPDGRALLYIDDHLANIWSQPVDGGKPMQLTNLQGDQIFRFDYSPDGKWLALARGRMTDDVILIRDFR